MNEKTRLILHFTTSAGYKKTFNIEYPKVPAVPTDVKALGNFILTNQMMKFESSETLAKFEGATIETVTISDVNLSA